ncbi:DUF866-domain-containing protein [Suhomyces tanzawaensis NRRL Y-17324]|uniref:DUF866-domain-containing protein n=1 Tax=Suhomyces tanzawaensis NRRL Y-17324 TaxID=984487 RepID=A0A1E4SS85_9ASCO|nr:DUF866-domain-containing protein [Suhomyces tanzawaensis NRRL Y-17324]ODV82361.1 DUF866-domain-containing protein [Suhomyces tanzawaensis NRRL Y-17324]
MVKFYLKVSATLTNIAELTTFDTPQTPFEYKFKIECTGCRTIHDKPVTINRFESHEQAGSKGEASFVFRCKECKREHSANILKTNQSLSEDSKSAALLEIDARGIDFVEFIPDGRFEAVGPESGTKFEEIDLEENEWYDFDEKAGEEVSITDVEWTISRS